LFKKNKLLKTYSLVTGLKELTVQ